MNRASCTVIEQISSETEKLISLFEKRDPLAVVRMFPNEPFLRDKIVNIMKFNKMKITSGQITVDANKMYNGWELRKITVLNKYPSLNKPSPEYMVLDFDNNGI
ncbi:MAG: hypothetical protein KJ799_15770 [Bacteroidetes bacterium]|nr:hypothetical protein [Bacteroidota bacterium]MBU1678861.1 hypothetical protein [Bacteroidota bacterium]MBU2508158.1 hypothetical protein [Bacteroidota bacterium]